MAATWLAARRASAGLAGTRGDRGEGSALMASPGLGRVIEWRRQHAAQGFEGLVVNVPLEFVGGVGLVLPRCVVHGVSLELVYVSFKGVVPAGWRYSDCKSG